MDIDLNSIQWEYFSDEGREWLSLIKATPLQAEPFKRSMHRGVFYLPEGIYIKIFYYSGIRSVIKHIIGGKACKDGKIALELQQRGINVPNVLAFGKKHNHLQLQEDLLITEEVPDIITLRDFTQECFPYLSSKNKRDVIRTFSSFIHQLHHTGVLHKDLNFGNILIQKNVGKYRFFLLDLDKVHLKQRQLTQKERIENLGSLLRMFWTFTSMSQKIRFLNYYDDYRQQKTDRSHLYAIRNQTLKIYYKKGRTRGRQCRSTHARFIKERIGSYTIFRVRNDQTKKILQHLLPNPESIILTGNNIKQNGFVTTTTIKIQDRQYVLKRYVYNGWFSRIKNTLCHSMAARTWMTTFQFLMRKLLVPSPMICIEERPLGIARRSYILSEVIENSQPLSDVLNVLNDSGIKRLLFQISIKIGWMHQVGCLHGDLSWDHILIQQSKTNPKIFLTHLDNSNVNRRIVLNRAKKDIDRFISDMKNRKIDQDQINMFIALWQKWAGFENLKK